ncbi:MAG: helix-turn-helix domain-containing protein [Chitinophagaceae bacterium]
MFMKKLSSFNWGKMAQKAIHMTRIRQVQQLRDNGVAIKEIACRTGISRKTVNKQLVDEQQKGREHIASSKCTSLPLYGKFCNYKIRAETVLYYFLSILLS